jgi:hypothetical protein
LTFSDREVVDPDDRRISCFWQRKCPDQPQQRGAGHLRRQLPGQALTGPAAQRQRDLLQHPTQQRTPARVRNSDAGDLLGERPLRAVSVVAEESPHQQPDHRLLPTDRGVRQEPLVTAMHPAGSDATTRAGSIDLTNPGLQLELCPLLNNLLDRQRSEVRKQRLQTRIVAPPT